jgi:2-iminobutanoate/2-iminopropanoate deaminase
MRKTIYTEKAPEPLAKYSQGIIVDDEIVTSGQIAIDLKTGKIVKGIGEQTKLCLKYNLDILEAGNASMSDVYQVIVYLANINLYPPFNEEYKKFMEPYFSKGDYPVRAVSGGHDLPKGALVEIMMRAKKVK